GAASVASEPPQQTGWRKPDQAAVPSILVHLDEGCAALLERQVLTRALDQAREERRDVWLVTDQRDHGVFAVCGGDRRQQPLVVAAGQPGLEGGLDAPPGIGGDLGGFGGPRAGTGQERPSGRP